MKRSRGRGIQRFAGGAALLLLSLTVFVAVAGLLPAVQNGQGGSADAPLFELEDKQAVVQVEPEASAPSNEPAPLTNVETGQKYAANRVLLSVDASTSEDDLEAILENEGVNVADVYLVSDAGNEPLFAVDYNGGQDPIALGEQLSELAEISCVEPDYIYMPDDCKFVDELVDSEAPADVMNSEVVASGEGASGEASGEGASGETAAEVEAPGAEDSDEASDLAATSDSSATDVAASEDNAPDATVNDEYYSLQWELGAVGATSAWDVVKSNQNVTVAVLDTGVDINHPDLKDNLILGSYAKNTYTETTGAYAVNDVFTHGTHVAGIVAARANNGKGTAGVSYNARILPIKVNYDEETGSMYTRDIVEAVDYVVDLKTNPSSPDYLKNIRVINMSLGGGGYMEAFEDAINRATAAGILVVATAGNNEKYMSSYYPASYNGVFGVSGLEKSSSSPGFVFDSDYSNWGPMVDISAPGTRLYAPVPTSSYKYKTGTSMAAPVVSGIAALNFAVNMNYTPAEMMALLQSTATDVKKMDTGASIGTGFDSYTGAGCVQAYASVSKAKSSLVNMSKVSVTAVSDQEYTGRAITPSVTLKYNGKTLVKDTDYTIAYSNNVNVGVASITLTGKGYYTGTKTVTFRIMKTTAAVRQVTVGKPTAATGLVYNGMEQRGVIDSSSLSTVLITGDNSYGQLGQGFTGGYRTSLSTLTLGAIQVAAGNDFSAAITADGSLYLWGANYDGRLGDGTTVTRANPVKIMSNVAKVALGSTHALALTKSGDVYAWGDNEFGQLGNGTLTSSSRPAKVASDAVDISAGSGSSAYVKKDGSLYVWGRNNYGQVGDGTKSDCRSPKKVLNLVKQVSLGGFHTMAVSTTGELYAWGCNSEGQLGSGIAMNEVTPARVVSSGVVFVDAGRSNTAYITDTGVLYMTGNGQYGQFGDGSTASSTRFSPVLTSVKSVDVGYASVAAVRTDGKLLTWGAGAQGKLGTGAASDISLPTVVAAGVEQAVFGNLHLIVLEQWPYYFEGTEKATKAGSYSATAKLRSHAKWTGGGTGNVTINWNIYGEYDMSDVKFESKTVNFTGEKQSLSISGTLPSGVSVSYVGNGQIEAGTYTVTAKFKSSSTAFAPIPDMTATLTIKPVSLLENCMVNVIPDQMYTGRPIEPKVILYLGDVVLTEGVHYKVGLYDGNVEPGEAWIRIDGIGSILGYGWTSFVILDRPIWTIFPDVIEEVKGKGGPEKLWYVRDGWLDYVVRAGLMSGYSDGNFGAHDSITRASVATMLYRAACADNPSLEDRYGSTTDKSRYPSNVSFKDMLGGKWYTAAINWAKDAGVMTGDGGTGYTTVRPNETVTRQELAVMIARYVHGTNDLSAYELDPSVAEGLKGVGEVAGWARSGMFWALNEGVMSGAKNSDGTRSLNPKANAERCEAAKMFTVAIRDIMGVDVADGVGAADGAGVDAAGVRPLVLCDVTN